MQPRSPAALAFGGLLALAAAIGIGRFVYTPILPFMLDALGWTKAQAGTVASANFLGYLLGAFAATRPEIARAPRAWLLATLAVSGATTLAMAADIGLPGFMALRFIGGAASAFVIVCASGIVLERLAAAGARHLAGIHFAGVGAGITLSAVLVSTLAQSGATWPTLWLAAGAAALLATPLVAWCIQAPPATTAAASAPPAANAPSPALTRLTLAYGLFGFGYVITATFLVTIVRLSPTIRPLEPWIWILFGLAAIPSVPLWNAVGGRIGLMRAYAVASLVEAVGVAASVEFPSLAGICLAALCLGGTFMGLTALGLVGARSLSAGAPQNAIARMTASFALGQMIGPLVAGTLTDWTGSFRAASLLAALGLVIAAGLTMRKAPQA